jgi:hypothetical protein
MDVTIHADITETLSSNELAARLVSGDLAGKSWRVVRPSARVSYQPTPPTAVILAEDAVFPGPNGGTAATRCELRLETYPG